jgi:Fe-S oxidoreductase
MTLKDDFLSLVGLNSNLSDKVKKILSLCITFDEFIANHLELLTPHFTPNESSVNEILLHVHCHQKALIGCQSPLDVLKAVPGFTVTEIKSGCCGMAGSFGYEKEHVELSTAIANLKLVPAIQKSPEAFVVANGISCRSQIAHLIARDPYHLAEILAKYGCNI